MDFVEVDIEDKGDALEVPDDSRGQQAEGPQEGATLDSQAHLPQDRERNVDVDTLQDADQDIYRDERRGNRQGDQHMNVEDETNAERPSKRGRSPSHDREERDEERSRDGYRPREGGRQRYRRDGPYRAKHRRLDQPFDGQGRDFRRRDTHGRDVRGRDMRFGDFHGPPRPSYNNWNPEIARAKRWDTQIITVLDKFDTAKEDILALVKVIADVNDTSKPSIATFERSVEAFPVKTAAYASVLGILRAKKHANLAEQIMQRVLHNLGFRIAAGHRVAAIHALRFLIGAHCSGITSCQVFQVITSLLDLAKQLEETIFTAQQEASNAAIAADNLMYIVMASLPWFSRDEFSKNKEQIHNFCELIKAYTERRRAKISEVTATLQSVTYDASDPELLDPVRNAYAYTAAFQPYAGEFHYTDRLESGVGCLESLLQHEWANTTTYRFYQSKGVAEHIFEVAEEPFVSEEVSTVTQEILQGLLNTKADKLAAFQPVPFLPFAFATDCPGVDQIAVHDRWLLEEHVLHTVQAFEEDTSLCANQLLLIPFNHEYAEHAIVEVLFNLMLSPIHRRRFAMFAVLVMQHMCSVQPRVETIFLSFYSQLTEDVGRLEPAVVADLLAAGAYWFSVEFCKVRKASSAAKPRGGGLQSEELGMEVEEPEVPESEDVVKEKIRQKNELLFSVMFKPGNASPINFNQRLLDKISRLVYMDRLLVFSPEALKDSIRAAVLPAAPNLQHALRGKPEENKLFLNLLHFSKLSAEEHQLRNQRIIGFINNLVGKAPLKAVPSNLFAEQKLPDVKMADPGEPADSAEAAQAPESADPEGAPQNARLWLRDDLVLIFWESLLIFGSKSLSHLLRLVELHGEVLTGFLPREPQGSFEDALACKVLALTRDTLKSDTKKFELVVEALLRQHILPPADACRFVYRLYPSPEFFSNYTVCILGYAFDLVREELDRAHDRALRVGDPPEAAPGALLECQHPMRDLLLAVAELTHNRLAQALGGEHELIVLGMFKHLLLTYVRELPIVASLRAAALQRGYDGRVAALAQRRQPVQRAGRNVKGVGAVKWRGRRERQRLDALPREDGGHTLDRVDALEQPYSGHVLIEYAAVDEESHDDLVEVHLLFVAVGGAAHALQAAPGVGEHHGVSEAHQDEVNPGQWTMLSTVSCPLVWCRRLHRPSSGVAQLVLEARAIRPHHFVTRVVQLVVRPAEHLVELQRPHVRHPPAVVVPPVHPLQNAASLRGVDGTHRHGDFLPLLQRWPRRVWEPLGARFRDQFLVPPLDLVKLGEEVLEALTRLRPVDHRRVALEGVAARQLVDGPLERLGLALPCAVEHNGVVASAAQRVVQGQVHQIISSGVEGGCPFSEVAQQRRQLVAVARHHLLDASVGDQRSLVLVAHFGVRQRGDVSHALVRRIEICEAVLRQGVVTDVLRRFARRWWRRRRVHGIQFCLVEGRGTDVEGIAPQSCSPCQGCPALRWRAAAQFEGADDHIKHGPEVDQQKHHTRPCHLRRAANAARCVKQYSANDAGVLQRRNPRQ
ncbi:nuclear cap-binding protein, putative [Babesia caballi]|uniref:Nuclear cap-binding protein, putative n=1 Tax=Babesia caballi TaxID=5871 RepID=A0AAV4LVA1_BABCB|nr:nuclear cap-binding protein, putative [Babesia caballi]